ncbi:hypothetical protein M8C21_008386 [Ambrosia artemisiifolia]|uniref:Replication factor A C-terminal domain-containing protein n=1 Tax=Ambrosia artemisiifolia TaxID=4212 RepID=A0AAD5GTG5_AMBAR|nr:hypothetical protein M8C21_008386 [Ambrosia artemisiifolia]
MLDVWSQKEAVGFIVVILQFGTLKYFQEFGYVNNAFDVSNLFINSEIDDEISEFRQSLMRNVALYDCCTDSAKMDRIFLSQYDEYVSKTEFNKIADVNVSKVKTVVVVATIELIPLDEKEITYYCKTEGCEQNDVPGLHRLKIPLTVQDLTGTLSLTLFDRDASNLLKKTSEELIEKHLSELIGKKFAFKIEISQFNVDKKIWVFKILKLTDNSDIISEFEKKANNYEPGYSESLSNMVSEPLLKLLPVSKADNANLKRQIAAEVIFKRKSNGRLSKRQLGKDYEEEPASFSATKSVSDGKKALLIPKIEK